MNVEPSASGEEGDEHPTVEVVDLDKVTNILDMHPMRAVKGLFEEACFTILKSS